MSTPFTPPSIIYQQLSHQSLPFCSSLDEKKRAEFSIDDSDVSGGGFHLLLFELLVDSKEHVWLLDIEGTPVFGDTKRDARVLEKENLFRDVLTIAGWIGYQVSEESEASNEAERIWEARTHYC